MGWDYMIAKNYKKSGAVDVKAECDARYTWGDEKRRVSVVRSSLVGSVWYGAVKVEPLTDSAEYSTFVSAVVCLTHVNNRDFYNFGVKSISEECSPCECSCPACVLNCLTETKDADALAWRAACREKIAEKKKSGGGLLALPIGSKIAMEWNGERIELVKRAPGYKWHRAWWYCVAKNAHMPTSWIKKYEIVVA